MTGPLQKLVRLGLRPAVSLALVGLASTLFAVRAHPRSYNVTRLGLADLTPSKNGYICGYDKYVYVTKWDSFVIVDVETRSIRGPYRLDPFNLDVEMAPGHGKACMSRPSSGNDRIHLIMPNQTKDEELIDPSIYIFDVHEWGEDPVLKGKIEGLGSRIKGGSFYSAFLDTSRIQYAGEPVWVFAVSNTCIGYAYQGLCNDTVYIFNIREILDAPVDDPGLPIRILAPDTIWYPGINPGFPPGPDIARGHDVTVHGNRLLVTNPGGGLYVVDTDPLWNQDPQGHPMVPKELGRCEYENAMTHDAWATEDLHYVFTSDEHFFEWGCNRPIGDITVYDIQGLGTPGLCNYPQAAKYVPSTAVTAHYCYIRQNLGYVANYNRGLRIFDVSFPDDPIEIGYYDTYLKPDLPPQYGVFDLWPFYDGHISACDVDSGVFVLQFDGALPACQGGVVQSAAGGIPIDGAWVYSLTADRGALSDENGYFELKTAKGTHAVMASAMEFGPSLVPAHYISGRDCASSDLNLTLQSNSSDSATAWNNGRKIAVDSAACIHVVYQNITLPHNDLPGTPMHSVTYAYSTDRGITWDFTSFEAAYYPSLAVDPDTVPHIVLLEHVGDPPNEHLVHYWKHASGQWQRDVIVSLPDKMDVIFTPAVAIYDETGPQAYYPPHVVWEYIDTVLQRTYIYYWNPSLGIPEEIVSADELHSLEFPSISFDGAGTPHVLWQDNSNPGASAIRHSSRANGVWQQSQVVALGEHPSVDEWGGGIYAVWEQGSPPEIVFGMYMGATWYNYLISETPSVPSKFPSLDDFNIVWAEESAGPGLYEIFYSKYYPNGPTDPQNLSGTPLTPSVYPQGCFHADEVIRAPCERFYVVWTEDLLSHQRVKFESVVPAEPGGS
ncbi:hypothetical protein E3J62_07505 [candidate division TA06 bacterium]|uniref:Uncharacterized protein n=1 Tax=candidate division TA06 bacterium TaxID=2250710 RepID=A0A523USG9_UNCT6|nr:MAG: hypothetical protein E3J62_07505 [candidate division TA06 bacterium]